MKVPRPRGLPARRALPLPILPILLVALLSVAGFSAIAPPSARAASAGFHPAAGTTAVVLTATNALSFVPLTVTVPTLSVSFEIENIASTDHTFTLSTRVNQTAPTGTDPGTNASGTWFDNAHLAADLFVGQGHTAFVNVTLPAAGSYQFICRYHFPGMAGTLVVGAAAPSDSSSTSLYLYAGLAVAVVVALAVVVVVLRRRSRPPVSPPAEPAK